jgi:imidazolonepropionase-like amidohydrolase
VKLLAGTDAPGTSRLPGESLVEELELMVQAGLTNAQALATATRHPAEFSGLADSVGTLAVGKVADFVLLDANPLERIGNLRQVAGVAVGGRYRTRPQLTTMVASPKRCE